MQNLLGNSKCLIDNKHDNVKLIGFFVEGCILEGGLLFMMKG